MSMPTSLIGRKFLIHAADSKAWGFCVLFRLLSIVSTSVSYFLPIILHNGMRFSSDKAILLNA
jgi:actin cytoskeleton-regulatory complex protein SLA1